LQQYQAVLERRDRNFCIGLRNKTTQDSFLYKPKTKSFFHPDFVKAYITPREIKLKERLQLFDCRMVTLTYSTKLYTPLSASNLHKSHIKKFIRLLRERFGSLEYCYFIELTKQLFVHFHVYINRYIPHQQIKEIWFKITGNSIVSINAVDSKKKVKYCSEYHQILKKFNSEQLAFVWKNIDRLFSQSRNFFAKSEKAESLYVREFLCSLVGDYVQSISESQTGSRYFWMSESELAVMCQIHKLDLIQTDAKKIQIVRRKSN